ncbi:glycosyltransferase family 4 protein [Alteraurantiacibacter aestuarii]|uniref:glycosyltransferase family 4 protein n=1 Tax=Alteraurantiacibacter aestuarii TaxID=650004 RepID=UPI0031D15731
MAGPRVLVTHTGARHNYVLPAAFADAGMLEAFYTDMCAGRGLGRFMQMAAHLPLPSGLAATAARLANRRPPANVLQRTFTDDLGTLRYELAARRAPTPYAQREELIEYVRTAGQRMARRGLGDATHLYTVFGHAGELARKANARGIPVLTDMIIALSTRRIVLEEHAAFPQWSPPPPDQSYELMTGYNPDEVLLSTTDVFVCPSPFVADDLEHNWDIDRSRIRIVPYALGSSWFDVKGDPVPGRVLFAGSAELRKGIHYLAFAAQLLPASIDIRVAGGVHDMVLAQPEAGALNFLGRVPRDLIQQEFASADIFVLPTLAEGSATVVYEAMAAGLPVITTRSAGSVIQDGVDGIIIPERDPQALADAIDRLVSDRPLRDAMSRAARANARHSNWERYGEELRQIVRETPSPIADHRSFRSTSDSGV